MQCIVCEEPNRLALVHKERPLPGPGEALVRIRRVGVCGTDLHAFHGRQPYFTYPRVLGHELSGVIEQLGPETKGWNEGDAVVILPYLECGQCVACRNGKPNCCVRLQVLGVHRDGGMCEYLAVPADHLLPADSLSLDAAAIVECLSIGAHAVRRGQLTQGEWTLVIGAGPIGLGVMKFAKLAGARVIALDLDVKRLAFAEQWAQVDAAVTAGADALADIARLTGGDLPTLVFDATGNAKSMMEAVAFTAHGGRLVYVGLVQADLTLHDPELHKRELTLICSRNALREDFAAVMEQLAAGRVDADAFITHRVLLPEVPREFPGWTVPGRGVIKAMITVGE